MEAKDDLDRFGFDSRDDELGGMDDLEAKERDSLSFFKKEGATLED